jgi:DNA-binding NarL/FixJ family response regulator
MDSAQMPQSSPIKILLVDDNPLILFSLEKIIAQHRDFKVVASARNGYDALAFLQDNQVDVVLLDIEMPIMNGIECLRHIRERYAAISVILLTTFAEDMYITEGLTNGARSYLIKNTTFTNLDQHIRSALEGTFVMPTHIATRVATLLQQKRIINEQNISPLFFQTYPLTHTEQQIIKLLGRRLSNAEIAEQLGLKIGTIKNHLVTIFEKIYVQNRQEAITLIENHFS